ncbi:hypothetical protein [Spirosoma arcticum]
MKQLAMEVINELEIRLVVTAWKIRQFNEILTKQRVLGADDTFLQASINQRDELEREFQRLSAQVRAAELAV